MNKNNSLHMIVKLLTINQIYNQMKRYMQNIKFQEYQDKVNATNKHLNLKLKLYVEGINW